MSSRSRPQTPDRREHRAPRQERWLQQEVVWFLEILGLSSLAVAQPVLDLFGKSAETFVFHNAARAEVVLFALLVALVPPLALWGIALCSRLFGARARRGFQDGLLGLLAAVIAIQILKKATPLLGLPLLLVALAFGAAAMAIFARAEAARLWVRFAAAGPVVFVGAFLLASPTAALLQAPPLPVPAAVAEPSETPVVFVVFDELPTLSLLDATGEINPTLFPNFAALSRRATWYRNFTTTEPATRFSLPTLLTGRLAIDRRRNALAAAYPENLFTWLRGSHQLVVFERHSRLCPPELCPTHERTAADDHPVELAAELRGHEGAISGTANGWPQELRLQGGSRAASALPVLLRDAVEVWSDLSLPRQMTRDAMGQFAEHLAAGEELLLTGESHVLLTSRFADLLRAMEMEHEKPGLYFIHLMLPHSPWRLYPSGVPHIEETLPQVQERPGTTGAPERRREEEWISLLTRQRHLLQAQHADYLVGELIRRLQALGLYDEALIVITADHGLSLRPGRDMRNAEWQNLHEILWVPLFVKRPYQRAGEIDDGNLMSIDLVPTIADILGVEIPWQVDGFPASDPRTERRGAKLVGGYHFLSGPSLDHSLYVVPSEQVEIARRRLRQEVFQPADPEADPRWWPYLVGPGAHLIGKPIAELEIGAPAGRRARLHRPALDRFREVDLDRGPLPAFLLGNLMGVDGPLDARVAVALNGRIGGVSEVLSQGRHHGRFSVLLPDFLFLPQANELQLFLVEGSVLQPLPVFERR